MEKLNWGIIGTGNVANQFAKEFTLQKSSAKLCAVSSRSIEKSQAFAQKYNIKRAYGGYDELLEDKDIDIVYIAIPHNFHFEIMKKALDNNKNILCEKPITLNYDELDSIVKIAKEKNLYVVESMTIYHMPVIKKVREWIGKKYLGKLKMLQIAFGSYKEEKSEMYFFNPQLAGGALNDIGVYAISLARLFMSSCPQDIVSLTNNHQSGVDETTGIIMRNKEEEISVISLTFRAKQPKKGVIAYEEGYFEIFDYPKATRIEYVSKEGEKTIFDNGESERRFAYIIEDVTNMIINNEENCTLKLTMDVRKIMDRCYKK